MKKNKENLKDDDQHLAPDKGKRCWRNLFILQTRSSPMACPWCLPRQRFRFPLRMSQESIPLLCAANADSSRQPRGPRWPQGWSNLRHSQPKGHQGARVRTEFSRDSRSPPRLFTANVRDKERISTFFLPSWSPATSQEETTVRQFVAPWQLLPALLELDFSSPAQQTRPDHRPPSSRPPLASHRHQHP